jgi:hypothetical protein
MLAIKLTFLGLVGVSGSAGLLCCTAAIATSKLEFRKQFSGIFFLLK